ncbi:MAG: dTDP-glucose 4,6-dehydratase [Candidatus Woykebacteria bacterium GWB1_45_5]|uniref:dTDP-glucose 4,6-dehydratase n=2 Tax=Candidatus Woykeibacteriota TaxID=1817899 RepID=A0A1G1W2R0_9BACT|nr:MAG: dTDP-glucose 4,6-dehydratase [Candidatus Woykebacteria bacterium GWA1_44_8]OGY23034.1 MAG: dTDP-glucose 4,6-dehydratase [Candidatus Woykebacteria bacterium GWB1_45_5]
MRLLVTGGAGFMGSDFVRYWVKRYPRDQVLVLDKLTYAGNLENLRDIEDRSNYKFIKGDICDGELVNKVIKGANIVVHFAAESHVDRSILDPSPFIKTNILGTQVLLEAVLKNKVRRFHHVSTDEVFGALPLKSKEKFKADSPYNPRSPYAASKAAADHLVRAYFTTYGLPVTITNSSNNFGPYHFPEKFIPLTITNAFENKKIPIYGDGLYVRDWLFVEDHTRACELALKKGKEGATYLVSADNEYPNIEIAKKILKILGKDASLLEFVKDRPGHDRRYALDAAEIKKLGFKPKYSFDDALRLTVSWFKENQRWWRRVKNKEYLKYYEQQYVQR